MIPTRPPGANRSPGGSAVGLMVGGAAAVVAFTWTMLAGSYNLFAAELIAAFLILISVPLARRTARIEQSPGLYWLVLGSLVLRLAGSVVRYLVAYGFYGGVADASTYNDVANSEYHSFRHFHFFWPNTGVFHGLVPWLDTVVYAIAGPTELGSFFLFAWINFIGTFLFYRAFRVGFPDGDARRYGVIVFFLPSLLYWPSSLGKEAWMMLAIGLASYGLAQVLASRAAGYLALAAGIGAMLLVRPHLALIFLPAAFFALLFRRRDPGRSRPLGRFVGIVVLVVAAVVVVAKAQSYLQITSLDPQTVTQTLNTTRAQTAEGNSTFSPPNAQSPLGYPEAVVTVLFRPFPFEAHGITVVVASLEGVIMLGLTVVSWRRLAKIPLSLRRQPYVIYSLVFSLLFVFAFSNFSNFGILVRERVQLLPLYLVLLCLPVRTAEGERERERARREPERALRRYGGAPAYPVRAS